MRRKAVLGLFGLLGPAAAADPVLNAVTLYASFDQAVQADFGGGRLTAGTRFNHETDKGRFVFQDGFDGSVFQIARGEGVQGAALRAADILPRNGRLYFPAKGNIAFRKGGWGGTVSFWQKTDPNTMLKTRFCDPVQITEKGANNGGLWVDFPDSTPRDFRLGAFPAQRPGQPPITESDVGAPLVVVKRVGFGVDAWHHVAFTWNNFDTGRADAEAALYIDGVFQGALKNREIAMDWDLEKAGIYFAVGYIGLLDELAVFNRPLSVEEIQRLHRELGLLGGVKKGGRTR